MKIVILDGFTANPGDLEWKELEEIGELIVFDRTSSYEIVSRCSDAEIVFTNKTPLNRETLSQLNKVKYIGVLATGFNVVDVVYARQRGIPVCNVPSYSTMSVAQNVFALILDFTNHVAHYNNEVKKGKWSECEDFCFIDAPLMELSGKQMGIVGLGNIGRQVAVIASSFGMKVAAYTSKSQEEISPIQKVELDTLFATSDIISLHCPLNESTYHIVDKERLSLMKSTGILINTGRGQLIDEEALTEALNNGTIAGAGLDVLCDEPPKSSNLLLSAKNVRITPHISWATIEARTRLLQVSIDNLKAFLSGNPVNVVN